MSFGQDVAARECAPVITGDLPAWAAAMNTAISDYLRARAGAPCRVEPPLVGIAGAMLGVAPLLDVINAVLMAMATPVPPPKLGPVEGPLERFAEAVDQARDAVCEYSTECWVARRKLLVAWSKRAESILVGSPEWERAVAEISVVVAEAEGAELRWTVFDEGIRQAIAEVEGGIAVDELDALIVEIEAAGMRHSAPSACMSH